MENQYIIYEIKQEHFQREFHRDTNHSQERRKISNKKPKLTSKESRKKQENVYILLEIFARIFI